jgi:hypothetical protein
MQCDELLLASAGKRGERVTCAVQRKPLCALDAGQSNGELLQRLQHCRRQRWQHGICHAVWNVIKLCWTA